MTTKAAEAIIERLKEDGHVVEDALKSMGSIAEPPLIALLRNPDADLRRKACEILKFVGTSATLKAMAKIPPDSDIGVRMAAARSDQDDQAASQAADDSEAPAKKKTDPPPASPFARKHERPSVDSFGSGLIAHPPDESIRASAALATSPAIEPAEPFSLAQRRCSRAPLRSPCCSLSSPMNAWASVC